MLVPGKKKYIEIADSLAWIRNNSVDDFYSVDDASVFAICNLAGVPVPRCKLSKDQNMKALADSVAWLRTHDPDLKGVDLALAAACWNAASTFF